MKLKESYTFRDDALSLLDDLKGEIFELMMEEAEKYAEKMPAPSHGKKTITPSDMTEILQTVIRKIRDERTADHVSRLQHQSRGQ